METKSNHCTVSCHTMHTSGKGVALLPSGKNIFITGAIPGEVLTLRRERKQQGFHSATIREIIQASPYRQDVFCAQAEQCGGCPWQHIAYEGQLKFKRELIINGFAKYNIPLDISSLPEVVPSPRLSAYRNKAQYYFAQDHERVYAGFHPENNAALVIECTLCRLLSAQVNNLVQSACRVAQQTGISIYNYNSRSGLLKTLLIRENSKAKRCICPGFSAPNSQAEQAQIQVFMQSLSETCSAEDSWYYQIEDTFYYYKGSEYLTQDLGPLSFQYRPSDFFQPNPQQAANFYQYIVELARAQRKMWTKEEFFAIDLYTGIGSIALSLAADSKEQVRVLGIEGNPQAIADAKRNAVLLGIDKAEFLTGDILETFTQSFIKQYPQPQLIVLDPPRSGTLIEIKKTIIAAHPQRIIYVSCNPVSLAWDLKQLLEGGYKLSSIKAFDMFPHSQHVETVALLEAI